MPDMTKRDELYKCLQEGRDLVASAFAHVSHGGPTRKDAEKWLEKVAIALAEPPESAHAPEPPGSVAGDEYEIAAHEWCGTPMEVSNNVVKALAGHFRAACGSRESELAEALTKLQEWLSDESQNWNDKNSSKPLPKHDHYENDAYLFGYNAGVSEGYRAASDRLAAARAKQGKETRT